MLKLPPVAYVGMVGVVGGIGYLGFQTLKPQPNVPVTYGDKDNVVRVAADPFSGYSTFRDDSFMQQVGKFNVGVRYQNVGEQKERAESLGKSSDIILTSLDQFVKHQPPGLIVGLVDRTEGADAVVQTSSLIVLVSPTMRLYLLLTLRKLMTTSVMTQTWQLPYSGSQMFPLLREIIRLYL